MSKQKKFGRYIVILIAACFVIGLLFCGSNKPEHIENFSVRIIHTNDIHARVTENKDSGIIGIEKLGSIIKKDTEQYDLNLVLDSGDLFHGQPIATLVYGESIAQLIKACHYDAMTAGNHDWSYGKQDLVSLAQQSDLKILTGNVIINETGEHFFEDEFLVKTITKDNITLKIGIFGVIDPLVYNGTTPENVAGLTFTDSVSYSREAVNHLKEQGCQVIIGLTHTNNPAELAQQVNGVNLWLAGHEHTSLFKEVETPNGDISYVIENNCYLKEIGMMNLTCKVDNHSRIDDIQLTFSPLHYDDIEEIEKDEQVSKVLTRINNEVDVILKDQVGISPIELNGIWEDLRIGETNLGVAVAESYLLASGADIAFENAGGIRASVNQGIVTFGEILGVSPYGNYLVEKQLTGAEIKETLEISLEIQRLCIDANKTGVYDAWPQTSGSVLQCAGLTAEYDLTRPVGDRITSLKIGTAEFEESKVYTVVTNNFNAWNHTYPALSNAPETGQYCACEEALIQFFKQSEETIKDLSSARHLINLYE